jgi:hypothetical protein
MATEEDKINTGALATLVAVGVFATLAVALGVDALVRFESSKVESERAGQAETQVRDLVREQRAQLDAQPLPIDRAMAAVVLDLRQNPWSATPAAPETDAGADAGVEATDAGTDAAVEADDGGAPAPEGTTAPSGAPAPTPAAPQPATPAPASSETKPVTPAPKAPAPTVPVTATAVKTPTPAPTAAAPTPAPTAAAPTPAPTAATPTPAPAPAAPAPKPTDG